MVCEHLAIMMIIAVILYSAALYVITTMQPKDFMKCIFGNRRFSNQDPFNAHLHIPSSP